MSPISEEQLAITRREAIQRVTALLGGVALVGGSSLLASCTRDRSAAKAGVGTFSAADVAFLDEIAETILPETKTPGAKAASVGAFMALMVTDTYEPKDQAIFRTGMQRLEEASVKESGASFMSATPQARLALLEKLDREQKDYHDAKDAKEKLSVSEARDREEKTGSSRDAPKKDDDSAHYFRMMKELTLLGYFTSEIGCTKAQRYVESPGKFEPCVPYTPGDPAWAGHA
jgi:glucoside 3-dehydrogenase (cytochrome c) hitch-hiker subunit